MKIYTLTGDDGTTSLPGGRRVPKHSPRVEAYGTIDEVVSWTGVLRDLPENIQRRDALMYIQDQLMRCAVLVASGNREIRTSPDESCLSFIEDEIDKMESSLPVLRNFIIPGGGLAASYCHVARTVCRRAERAVTRLNETEEVPVIVQKILNRLSDYLFVLARKITKETDNQEIKWPPDPVE
jgi:cob(I)alamin adenosyltransferase